jgi:ubiquinone biosynthesis protein UbiJ
MDTVTIRLQPETIEELDAEFEERGFRNRTLYLRHLIDNRDVIFDEEGTGTDTAERLADHDEQLEALVDRFENLDERLENLEEQARPFSWTSRSS